MGLWESFVASLGELPANVGRFFRGLGVVLSDLPGAGRRFFSVSSRDENAPATRSNHDWQILVGQVGIVLCGLLGLTYVVLAAGVLNSSAPAALSTNSPVPSHLAAASPAAAASPTAAPTPYCATAPAATAVPAPSQTAAPVAGNFCSYLSGVMASYYSALDPTAAGPLPGQSLKAILISIDGGGLLPPDTTRTTSSGADGSFAFAVTTAASWRLLYEVPSTTTPGVMIDYPITVVAASSGSNFGPASAPPCSDAGALGEDASFHFAGDVRVVLAISVCPGPVLLANVAQIDIPRVAVVAPTPQVFYNPVNVMLNFSSELRYSEVAATAKSVADMGSGNGSDLLIPFLLLAVTAVWAAATYWIKARMYNLDRLPQAYFVEEDQDII